MVKNTKAKIARTHKKYGINLTDEINIKPLESFTTRKEFNEFVQQASSFTNRNNLKYQFVQNVYGLTASKSEINKITRDTKQAQRIAEKLQRDAIHKPFISGGKEQGTVGQRLLQMGKPSTAGIVRPPDFNFQSIHTKQQFEKKKKNMEERSDEKFFDKRMEKMKDNFMKILDLNFNSDAERLNDKLKNVPADDFYEMYLMFDEFDFDLYDSENAGGFSDEGNLRQMEEYVDNYILGRVNMDLKGI